VIVPPEAVYVPAAPLPSIPLKIKAPVLCAHPVPPAPITAVTRSFPVLQPAPPRVTVGTDVYPRPPAVNVTVFKIPEETVYVPAAPDPPPPLKIKLPDDATQPQPAALTMFTWVTLVPTTLATDVERVRFHPTYWPLTAEMW